jgi:hypothetical protein
MSCRLAVAADTYLLVQEFQVCRALVARLGGLCVLGSVLGRPVCIILAPLLVISVVVTCGLELEVVAESLVTI